MKREHQAGFYLDRIVNNRRIATTEEAIRVSCTRLIGPTVLAQVARRLAPINPPFGKRQSFRIFREDRQAE